MPVGVPAGVQRLRASYGLRRRFESCVYGEPFVAALDLRQKLALGRAPCEHATRLGVSPWHGGRCGDTRRGRHDRH